MANPFIFGGVSPSAGNGSAGENRGAVGISGIFKGQSTGSTRGYLQSTGSFTRMENKNPFMADVFCGYESNHHFLRRQCVTNSHLMDFV